MEECVLREIADVSLDLVVWIVQKMSVIIATVKMEETVSKESVTALWNILVSNVKKESQINTLGFILQNWIQPIAAFPKGMQL